jgi:hypothetical protein
MGSLACRHALAEQIREYLRNADQQGELPIARGTINRGFIRRKFGCPYSWTRSGEINDLLSAYDLRLRSQGYAKSKFDGMVEKVQHFLERGLADGSIPIYRKAIDRQAVRNEFGFSHLVLTRHEGMKNLLKEFDARLEERHFQKSKFHSFVEPLNRLIHDYMAGTKSVPLHLGRLNRTAIGQELGIDSTRLHAVPILRDILADADVRISNRTTSFSWEHYREGIKVRRPWLEIKIAGIKRTWDFNPIADQFSVTLAERLIHAFRKFYPNQSESRRRSKYDNTLNIFEWLHKHREQYPRIFEDLNQGEMPEPAAFEWAVARWREEKIEDAGTRDTSANQTVNTTSTILGHLASAGILPKIPPLRPLKGARAKTQPRKSVAEVARIAHIAQDALRTAARTHQVDIAPGDETAFLQVLGQEAERRTDLPDDPIAAIRMILGDRLAALRACAVKDFDRWSRHYDHGQDILGRADMDGRSVESLVYSTHPDAYRRRQHLLSALPSNRSETALGRFLAMIEYRWGGCSPRGMAPETKADRGQFYSSFYRKHGGYKEVDALLNAHPEAINAVIVLYLVDSGANVSTARTLPSKCLQTSEIAGHKRISGTKMRGEIKAIFHDLPVKVPELGTTTVQAVEKLITMTTRYREQASEQDKEALFLVRPQSNVIPLPESLLTSWFKAFCARHPELAELKLLPSMIRPSVLLDLALSKDGNLIAAQYKAHHSDVSTTDGYTRKWPMRLLYEEKMKRFMQEFQAIAIAPIAGAAERIGISVMEAEQLLDRAERNGLGILCLKPKAGIQPGTKAGVVCHIIERCLGCSAQIVVPEPEAIADMIIFNEELWKDQERFEAEQDQRWEELWLLWLAFTEVVLEEMSKGPQAAILAKAREIATLRRADPSFVPIRPW